MLGGQSTDTESSPSEEVLAAFQESQGDTVPELAERLLALEERFQKFHETLLDDSAYESSDVTDLTSWLGQMEDKIASQIKLQPSVAEESNVSEKPMENQEEHVEKTDKEKVKERVAEERQIAEDLGDIVGSATDIDSQMFISAPELQATNERLKKLASSLNDQLHSLRDKVFLLDNELKRMAKGVEFALMRAKFAGANDMVSQYSVLLWIHPS